MNEHIVQSGQSLLDVAVIRYGDVSGITWLIEDNNLSGPVDRIYEGQRLLIRQEAINQRQKIYLQDYSTIATITDKEKPEGIGFWAIEEYVVEATPLEFDGDPYVRYEPTYALIIIKVTIQGSHYTRITNMASGNVYAQEPNGYTEAGSLTHLFLIQEAGEYEIQVENLIAYVTIII